MNIAESMDLFLKPRSVAVIGASRRTGRGSFNVVENLLQLGFEGQIYPVNPNVDSILDVKVYREVRALPFGIDLAVVILPRGIVGRIVSDCADRGIRAVIVITEGFAEADEEGKTLQSEIVDIAREKGVRILGPNSQGVVNGFHGFSSCLIVPQMVRNPVTFVCQSGGFLEGFSGFVPGKSIDLGNMCDIDFTEVLQYLEDDPETRVIALHIEGIKEAKRFLQAATRSRQKKPILVLKAGRSENAVLATRSHTGSLAGRDEIYRAIFRQAGLIQVDNVEELGDITKAFLESPLLRGNRVAILSPSGGAVSLSLDAMAQHRFELAKLSAGTMNAIKEFFPHWLPPLNPIDMMAAGMRHGYKMVYGTTLEALLDDKKVDAVLCVAGFPTIKTIKSAINGKNKPVATWVLGGWDENLLSRAKETGYQLIYPSPERAFRALAALRDYSLVKSR